MKHQEVIKIKTDTKRLKRKHKYAQLKRFYYDPRLKLYMYTFMYVDPKTIPVEDHFPVTKKSVVNFKKISTPGPVSKIGLDLVVYFQNIMSLI